MASQTELIGITRNPVPNGAVAGTFTARDGLSIRYARWDTTAARRLGTVCLFQGRTEFIEKYFETITDLRRRGFAVATMDWRGQGGSSRLLKNPAQGARRDVRAPRCRCRHLHVARSCSRIARRPIYCLAHSMGGHLVLRLTQTKACWWDRIVLTAPMIAFAGSEAKNAAISAIAETATFFGLGDSYAPRWKNYAPDLPFEGNVLTSDRLRYDRARDVIQAAPHLSLGRANPGLGYGRFQLHCGDQLRCLHGERQGADPDFGRGQRPDRVDAGDRAFREPHQELHAHCAGGLAS